MIGAAISTLAAYVVAVRRDDALRAARLPVAYQWRRVATLIASRSRSPSRRERRSCRSRSSLCVALSARARLLGFYLPAERARLRRLVPSAARARRRRAADAQADPAGGDERERDAAEHEDGSGPPLVAARDRMSAAIVAGADRIVRRRPRSSTSTLLPSAERLRTAGDELRGDRLAMHARSRGVHRGADVVVEARIDRASPGSA